MRADRYDFVIHGATGFTGREALRYLLSKPPRSLGRWAISGRDGGRLAELLATMAPERDDIDILVADTSEPEAMQALAASTRVVVNFAGPYARHGSNVLRACVEQRTHYLDLTGEIPWVRRMIEAYHAEAERRRVKLIFCAGYESLPFDIITLVAARALRERNGVACRRIDIVADARAPAGMGPGDMVSGGTMNTMREALATGPEEGSDDPAALIDDPARALALRSRNPIEIRAWYDEELGGYIGPIFPAPFINPPVIHRSTQLLASAGEPFADDFVYREGTKIGEGMRARLATEAICLSLRGVSAALAGGSWIRQPLLALLDRIGPRSGEGPSEKALSEMQWELVARAEGSDRRTINVRLHGAGHPGYRSTAAMIVESGLALAFDGARLPTIFGAVTPAAGLGTALLERLRDARIEIRIEGEATGIRRAAGAV